VPPYLAWQVRAASQGLVRAQAANVVSGKLNLGQARWNLSVPLAYDAPDNARQTEPSPPSTPLVLSWQPLLLRQLSGG
jgi:hypothetical protein